MKKTILAVSIFAALVMSGCRPETRNQMLGIPDDAILLSTERFSGNDTKTSVSGTSVQWVTGDQIDFLVGDNDTKQTRTVTVAGESAYISDGLTGTGVIRGYYPSGIATSFAFSGNYDKPRINFKSVYECSVVGGRQVIELPMVAQAVDETVDTIRFKHLTAAVNVKLRNSMAEKLIVDSVVVLSDQYRITNSSMTINLADANYGLTPSTGGESYRKVKVYFSTPFEVESGSYDKSIQVPILPINSDYLTIKVYCHNSSNRYSYSYKPASKVPALARNEMLTAQVDLNTSGHMEVNHNVSLAAVMGNFTAVDGDVLSGTPTNAPTVTIPDGATITLNGVNCTSSKYLYLRAKGDVYINLVGTNTMRGTTGGGSLLHVVPSKTLTIQGGGTLNIPAISQCAAIGSFIDNPCGNILIKSGIINITGYAMGGASIGCYTTNNCGDITIEGGSITVTGGYGAAGIGAANNSGKCGDISITGGTVSATGGNGAAGIGTGNNANSECGTITIGAGVTSVTATKGSGATESIGRGNASSNCGTVTKEDGANVTEN